MAGRRKRGRVEPLRRASGTTNKGQRETGAQAVQAGNPSVKPSVSVRHLRAACPGASADFLIEMIEAGRSIPEAGALWRARRIAAEIEAERAARLAAEAKLSSATVATVKETVKETVKATVKATAPRAPRNRYWL